MATKFIQPQNRENDLKAILEDYEQVLQKSKNWLAEAFQKDAIQNSWDARRSRKEEDWSCKLIYSPPGPDLPEIIVISDSGTHGLTGRIPKSREEEVKILQKQDRNDRLAFFLSSNWSNKPEDALGTRGRGKMLFIGASKTKTIFFESVRVDDKQYVFGKIYLNRETKDIEVEFYLNTAGEQEKKRVLNNFLSTLNESGTRIFIVNPRLDLKKAFQNKDIELFIQQTWWEILHKYNADIRVISGGEKFKIQPSPWLPISKVVTEHFDNFGLIDVDKGQGLRIKNISLAFLGEKEIPDSYRGIAIQRGGMTVQRIPVTDLIGDQAGEKIYGAVELEEKFEQELARNEGPEHCTIHWTRVIPRKLRNILRQQTLSFARKFNLIGEKKEYAKKVHKDAADEAAKELNDLAKRLGFLGPGLGGGRTVQRKRRLLAEKLRLSIAEFETPNPNGRVNFGEVLKGAYAVPINETEQKFRIFVKTRMFNESGDVIKSTEEEIVTPTEEPVLVGWSTVRVDDTFLPGKYTFRAEMFAKEDKDFGDGMRFEKGGKVYHPVSRNFYVEEDPPEEGLFKIMPDEKEDKGKYIWVEPEDRGYILYYNTLHPLLKLTLETEDKNLIRELLIREGLFILFSLRLTEDISLSKEGDKPTLFSKKQDLLRSGDFDQLFELIARERSRYLWERSE